MADVSVIMESELASSEGERGPGQNPWPYVSTMFRFLSRKGNSLKIVCLLCAPAYKEVSAYVSSPSYLRKHIQVSIYKICIFMLLMDVTVIGWLIIEYIHNINDNMPLYNVLKCAECVARCSDAILELIILCKQGFILYPLPSFSMLVCKHHI